MQDKNVPVTSGIMTLLVHLVWQLLLLHYVAHANMQKHHILSTSKSNLQAKMMMLR
jgi:hypothetical protein